MIIIKVNGKGWEISPGTNVGDLLSRLKIPPKVCVVEVNGEIIPLRNHRRYYLREGDKVEVIRLMAGG